MNSDEKRAEQYDLHEPGPVPPTPEEEWLESMKPCTRCGKSGFECECPPECPICGADLDVQVIPGYATEKTWLSTCTQCDFSDSECNFALWMIE
jgi:hypothetical protein